MGSKNMKAIVIRGTGGVKVNDIENTTKRIIEPVSYTHLDVYKRQA